MSIDLAAESDIREQPEVLRRLLEHERDRVQDIAGRIDIDRIRYVLVAGRGSSYNVVRYAQYLFGAERRWPVAAATPSLFTRYGAPPHLDGALVIAVSQTGTSADVVEVVAEARRQGRPTIGITNVLDSPLAETAEHVIGLHAGPEQAGIATKTYVASMTALAMLGADLHHDPAFRDELLRLPDTLEQTIVESSKFVGEVADALAQSNHASVIGRGFNYSTAHEIALKLTSLTRITSMAYSAADAIRGPMASVAESAPVLLVAPTGRVLSDVIDLIPELRSRNVELVCISDIPEVLAEGDFRLPLPEGIREWTSPILAVVPGQLLAVETARRQATLGIGDDDAAVEV